MTYKRKNPKLLLQFWVLFFKLSVRSYLMYQHQITKIIRFGDRYDFTKRLVPNDYYSFITVKRQDPKLKTSLFQHVKTSNKFS